MYLNLNEYCFILFLTYCLNVHTLKPSLALIYVYMYLFFQIQMNATLQKMVRKDQPGHIQHMWIDVCRFVDSRSVLQSLQTWDCGVRTDLIFEIKYLIHLLRLRNLGIVLWWVPSHCGIYWNDYVDKLAKRGASNQYPSKICHSSISYNEFKTRIKTNFKSKTKDAISPLYLPKRISTLLLKLRLNKWRTKFIKEVKCSCGEYISIQHILFECKDLTDKYKEKDINIEKFNNINELLNDRQILNIIDIILNSSIAKFL